VEAELAQSKNLSGYDCSTRLDCFQADGSGYQVIPQDAVPASVWNGTGYVNWHGIQYQSDGLIYDWFLEGNNSWSANKAIEWLTRTATTTTTMQLVSECSPTQQTLPSLLEGFTFLTVKQTEGVNSKVAVVSPTGSGPFPLAVYFPGTTVCYKDSAPLQYIHKLAQQGFVAASIEYKDYDDDGGKTNFRTKAQLITNGSDSAMGRLCALSQVDCSMGIASMGYSQGGHIALLVSTYMRTVPGQPKVTSAYMISSGQPNALLAGLAGNEDQDVTIVNNNVIEPFLPKEKRRYTFFVGDDIFGPTVEAELAQSKNLSGYDCSTRLDCFQADGSGYQVIPQDAVPASVWNGTDYVNWHGIQYRSDGLIYDWFLEGNSSWSANKGIEWLSRTARIPTPPTTSLVGTLSGVNSKAQLSILMFAFAFVVHSGLIFRATNCK
jgi:dienelactone hydrolase